MGLLLVGRSVAVKHSLQCAKLFRLFLQLCAVRAWPGLFVQWLLCTAKCFAFFLFLLLFLIIVLSQLLLGEQTTFLC